jgi:hypothetical protein
MKIKASELTGTALDWAVEQLEIARMIAAGEYLKKWWIEEKQTDPSPYSDDWLRTGPIIERECIDLFHIERAGPVWEAEIQTRPTKRAKGRATTPLIAACRCYVASKLGDEIEVPDELIPSKVITLNTMRCGLLVKEK